jgi:hypothetical protein
MISRGVRKNETQDKTLQEQNKHKLFIRRLKNRHRSHRTESFPLSLSAVGKVPGDAEFVSPPLNGPHGKRLALGTPVRGSWSGGRARYRLAVLLRGFLGEPTLPFVHRWVSLG